MGKHSDFRIWIGGPLEVRTHPLPPPGLACVMQDLKLLSFNVQWFRDLGASFSSFRCFVFEILVLRFRDLGASFSRFGCSLLWSSFPSASFSKLTLVHARKRKIIKKAFTIPYQKYRIHTKKKKIKRDKITLCWSFNMSCSFQANDIKNLWSFVDDVLLPFVFTKKWYNGDKDQLEGFTDEKALYIMGMPRLRQLRNKPGTSF